MIDASIFEQPGAVFIRCKSDEPLLVTPFVIKGAIIKSFPNEKFISFINGEFRGTIAYPRVQVKVLRGQLSFFAVNEGILPTLALVRQLDSLVLNGKEIEFSSREEEEFPNHFIVTPEKYQKYKFITPWVALNELQIYRYEPMFTDERREFLNSVLEKNLEFIVKDLGVEPIAPIQVRFRASSLTPKIVPYSKLGSFKGYFTTNVSLPDYIGLGNNITKGLGTIIKWKYAQHLDQNESIGIEIDDDHSDHSN